ncbi:hypothetical protein GGQ54_000370 [Naumannella cuiyingiana]|uniref:DNA-binding protein n=1 Tax=Naumannella cuiyingiana TaxID=1347891 RepID=A0A7Z0D6M4_9ACTN|nr:Zn-ribbon domain-containing OB-fold protein [Naumannella cuiyingiana]NYI69810.1 hypothetical protein [Naumannella cuiyingiana]
MAAALSERARPVPTPETAEYWEGARRGVLRIQRCTACEKAYFYPRPYCPNCSSTEVEWFDASGDATLLSYNVNHRLAPGYDAPYAIAIVRLAEGPQMMTNIVDIEPDALELDMELHVQFQDRGDDLFVPVFAPKEAAA